MIWDAVQALDPDKSEDAKELMSTSMKAAQFAEADAPLDPSAGRVLLRCTLQPSVSYSQGYKLGVGKLCIAYCILDLAILHSIKVWLTS